MLHIDSHHLHRSHTVIKGSCGGTNPGDRLDYIAGSCGLANGVVEMGRVDGPLRESILDASRPRI